MLSQKQLVSLATKYQTTEINVLREYIQHLLLSYLYQQPETDNLFFKGGTALRLIHHSPRFSDDLDFDTPVHQLATWEKAMETMLFNLSHEGVEVDVSESTPTSGGYLAIITVNEHSHEIAIQFEISFRESAFSGEVVSITNEFIPSYPLHSLALPKLVEGKMHALFERQKARDFYDLYFLLRANYIPISKKNLLVKAKTLLSKSSLNFERELALFLPRSQSLLIRNFKDALTQEINRHI